MFNSPIIILVLSLIVIFSLVQLIMAFVNKFLFLPLIVSLVVLGLVFLTKTFVTSTIIIPFLNLLIGFSIGILIIMIYISGKSVKTMQEKFVALIDFQLINFAFAWVFLIFSVLIINK